MAKLGMPEVNIAFKEKGIEAIKRSERGIVAMILEESSEIIEKLLTEHQYEDETVKAITNPFTIYSTDDIPLELTDNNKDYITKCLIGYVTTPHRIRIYLQAKPAGAETSKADKWQNTLKKMYTDRWDYLVIPTITVAEVENVYTWVKTNRENKHKKVKAVLPNSAADYEGVINVTNASIKTASKTYTTAEFCARVAGIIAGTPMTIAATYAPLPEVIEADRYDDDENDEKVNKGEFFVFWDGEKYKMSRAMNSLVTTTEGKLEAYQTIKTVDIMDMIHDDIRKTAQDSYIAKYTNDYDEKCLLIGAIMGYFKELEKGRLLQKGYSTCEIDIEAVKNYLLSTGKYTQDELADMSDQELKEANTKKKVFLKASISILDSMEDIYLPIAI